MPPPALPLAPLVSGAPKSSGYAATKGFALVRLKAPPLPINASPFPSFARGEHKNLAISSVCLRPFNNKRAVLLAKSIASLMSSRKEVNPPLSSMLTGLKRCKTGEKDKRIAICHFFKMLLKTHFRASER